HLPDGAGRKSSRARPRQPRPGTEVAGELRSSAPTRGDPRLLRILAVSPRSSHRRRLKVEPVCQNRKNELSSASCLRCEGSEIAALLETLLKRPIRPVEGCGA